VSILPPRREEEGIEVPPGRKSSIPGRMQNFSLISVEYRRGHIDDPLRFIRQEFYPGSREVGVIFSVPDCCRFPPGTAIFPCFIPRTWSYFLQGILSFSSAFPNWLELCCLLPWGEYVGALHSVTETGLMSSFKWTEIWKDLVSSPAGTSLLEDYRSVYGTGRVAWDSAYGLSSSTIP